MMNTIHKPNIVNIMFDNMMVARGSTCFINISKSVGCLNARPRVKKLFDYHFKSSSAEKLKRCT